MPIPELDIDGHLPPGLHDCDLDEIGFRFGVDHLGSRRSDLFSKLVEFVGELRSTTFASAQLLIDGSFVTGKPQPNDIDLILILPLRHDFASELRPFEYNLVSRRRVTKRYGFDLLLAREGSAELQEYVAFFEQIRGDRSRRKGLLRVRR